MVIETESAPQERELMDFLMKAKHDGYAFGKAPINELDGTHSTRFSEGDYDFHDNWYGEDGTPVGGIEKVSYRGKPCWEMIYFGKELVDDREAISVLRQALSSMPDSMPTRGPNIFESGEYTYKNKWEGDINHFAGLEVITRGDAMVYNLAYRGGRRPLHAQTR